MVEPETANVSISPLLRELSRQKYADEAEIKAARILGQGNRLSEIQGVVFIGFLVIQEYPLSQDESQEWQRMLNINTTADDHFTNIGGLIERLASRQKASPDEIADVFSLIFHNGLQPTQCAVLLALMAYTELDLEPQVLAKAAHKMRQASAKLDHAALRATAARVGKPSSQYGGGLCDLVGTGGDGHSTYNVSTTASLVSAAYLLLAKHGNRASSSTSGSADLLQAIKPTGPIIEAVKADNLPSIFAQSPYAFLFAPQFHPGMKYVAPIRKEMGIRTIFNLLGPLANPVNEHIEARVVGVAEASLGPVFAEALRISGSKKALVVCGAENLDEISCAGVTHCWHLAEFDGTLDIQSFDLHPRDFGLATHPLASVAGGRLPHENADVLTRLLANKLDPSDPILTFVLLNTAALLVVAGLCESSHAEISETGPGGLRWKEGVRLARIAIRDGDALKALEKYIAATRSV